MNRSLTVALFVLAAAVAVGIGAEPPKPSIVPKAWELEFTYEVPRPITLKISGEDKPQTFWYMLYRVINETGKDQIFVPDFTLYTDTGQVLRAGEHVPSLVFTAVQKLHNNPLLVDLPTATGRILQGEDNSKYGVAIWRDIDPKARRFDIFVSGLSGEREKVTLPEAVKKIELDREGNKKEITTNEAVLAKTLKLGYFMPGEAESRTNTLPQLDKKEWVMR
jgi:hypothetical protein